MAADFLYSKGRVWTTLGGRQFFFMRYTATDFAQATVGIPFPTDPRFHGKLLRVERVSLRLTGEYGGVRLAPAFFQVLDNPVPSGIESKVAAHKDDDLCWTAVSYIEVPKSGEIGEVTAADYQATDDLSLTLSGELFDHEEEDN